MTQKDILSHFLSVLYYYLFISNRHMIVWEQALPISTSAALGIAIDKPHQYVGFGLILWIKHP